ncbi:type VI secretion system baseplate subunit TssG [Reinekea blandensis]|nr:type VI secretion system baseplate subunit TssG [Reinekea blandensis]
MEPGVWQQSPVLTDILAQGHQYQLHQLLFLLEQLTQHGETGVSQKVKIRPDTSLAFPASDVRRVDQRAGNELEVIVRFMGLYGVDSPLPQYFLDDVTEGGADGQRLQAFLDIFNQRLYELTHQAWKKQNLVTEAGEEGLYRRMVSGLTGQYWQKNAGAMAFGGSYLGTARDAVSLEDVLKEATSFDELSVDTERVTWIPIEDGLTLDGQKALGVDTCLGDAIPMIGKQLGVDIGPVSHDDAQDFRPGGEIGDRMAELLKTYLPEGVDFDVSIKLKPRAKVQWALGQHDSQLGVHTQLGGCSERALTMKLTSEQYNRAA